MLIFPQDLQDIVTGVLGLDNRRLVRKRIRVNKSPQLAALNLNLTYHTNLHCTITFQMVMAKDKQLEY